MLEIRATKESKNIKNKGITLIALVITIIVLLILVGISIATLTGENGILLQAITAKERTEIASEKEKIGIAYTAAKIEAGGDTKSVKINDIRTELEKQFGEGKVLVENTVDKNWLVTIYDTGRKYLINADTGEIKQIENGEEVSVIIDNNPGVLEEIENGIYQISSIEDLVAFSYEINSGAETYEGKTVILERRLDFNEDKSYVDVNAKYEDVENIGYRATNGTGTSIKELMTNKNGKGFIPIGIFEAGDTNSFKGKLDGKGNYIANIYINSKLVNVGLFGQISSTVEISNIGIESGEIRGGVRDVGGLVGNNFGDLKISNSYNKASCKGSNGFNGGRAGGGVLGWLEGGKVEISGCSNQGEISLGTYMGGITGGSENHSGEKGEIIINDSYNNADILDAAHAGGLIGVARDISSVINNSYNTGDITGDGGGYLGGLIGHAYHSNITINNCYNDADRLYSKGPPPGGLIGYAEYTNNLTINNSYNNANVVSSASGAGGIIGDLRSDEKVNISKSLNRGKIEGRGMSGGLIGNCDALEAVIENSYNIGNVESFYSGGIIGSSEGAEIINCYNSGDITSDAECSGGGIIGNSNDVEITNCYNIGKITGIEGGEIGGIAGNSNVIRITNCYYLEGTATKINGSIEEVGNVKTKKEMQTDVFLNLLKAGESTSLWIRDDNKNEKIPFLNITNN